MRHISSNINIGPALIALASALLATRLLEFGPLERSFLSTVLITIGVLRRESAWFIPGGILAGIGLGNYLTDASPLAARLSEDASGGVFLLSFALGWVSVFALSRRLGDAPDTWALIPALVMSVIGALVLSACWKQPVACGRSCWWLWARRTQGRASPRSWSRPSL